MDKISKILIALLLIGECASAFEVNGSGISITGELGYGSISNTTSDITVVGIITDMGSDLEGVDVNVGVGYPFAIAEYWYFPAIDVSFSLSLPSSGCSEGEGCDTPDCTACTHCYFETGFYNAYSINCSGQNFSIGFWKFSNLGNVNITLNMRLDASPPANNTLKMSQAGSGYESTCSFSQNPTTGCMLINDTSSRILVLNLGVSQDQQIWLWSDFLSGKYTGQKQNVTVNFTSQTTTTISTTTTTTIDDWLMFRHDSSHSGYTTNTGALSNTSLWSYTTSNDVLSSPAVADGVVYVGSLDGNIYALNASTGAYIWNYGTGGSIDSSPAVVNGMVYVGSWDRKVYAFNASTGVKIWNYTTGTEIHASPAVSDGMVYIASYDKKVYAFNASTGVRIWNYTTDSYVYSSPVVANGMVHAISSNGRVYTLNASTGTHIWNYTVGGYIESSPAVANGMIYFGGGDGDTKVYALNSSTGELIWNYTTGNSIVSSPAVADGVVYIGSLDSKLYAQNASTGVNIWKFTAKGSIRSSPTVSNGVVYVGSDDNKIHAVNASTGVRIWNYTTGDDVYSSPAVWNGVVYFGSLDDKIYAIGVIL